MNISHFVPASFILFIFSLLPLQGFAGDIPPVQALSVQQKGAHAYCGDYPLPGATHNTLVTFNTVYRSYDDVKQKWLTAKRLYEGLYQRRSATPGELNMKDALGRSKYHYAAMSCVKSWFDDKMHRMQSDKSRIIKQVNTRKQRLTQLMNMCGSVKKTVHYVRCKKQHQQELSVYAMELNKMRQLERSLNDKRNDS